MPSHSVSTLSRASWLAFIVFLAATPVPASAIPGDIYVSRCCEVDEIDRVSPDGSVTTFATSGLNTALGLAFDATGSLFVANSGNSTIEKFARNGVGTVFASTGLNGPVGLAFDASGNLFVANNRDNTIEKFAPNGVGTVFASTGLNGPLGLAFDASGNLFAANAGNNTIEKFAPNGADAVFASSVFLHFRAVGAGVRCEWQSFRRKLRRNDRPVHAFWDEVVVHDRACRGGGIGVRQRG